MLKIETDCLIIGLNLAVADVLETKVTRHRVQIHRSQGDSDVILFHIYAS